MGNRYSVITAPDIYVRGSDARGGESHSTSRGDESQGYSTRGSSVQDTTHFVEIVTSEIIEPTVKIEIAESIEARSHWRKVSNTIEAIAHSILVIATILALAATFFDNKYLIFTTACCNATFLALIRYSVYAENESREYHRILEKQLGSIGARNIAEVVPQN